MMRYALIASLCACLALGVGLWWVSGQRDAALASVAGLRTELATAKMRQQQAEDAVAVHQGWVDRANKAAAAAADRETEFQEKEGGDAPLSDYLRDALNRVR